MSINSGLDISPDAGAICAIADTGETLWQGKVLGDPDAIVDTWSTSRVSRESTCQSGSGRFNGEDDAAGQRLRTLTAARKAAARAGYCQRVGHPGLLRPLWLKIGAVTRVRFEARG